MSSVDAKKEVAGIVVRSTEQHDPTGDGVGPICIPSYVSPTPSLTLIDDDLDRRISSLASDEE